MQFKVIATLLLNYKNGLPRPFIVLQGLIQPLLLAVEVHLFFIVGFGVAIIVTIICDGVVNSIEVADLYIYQNEIQKEVQSLLLASRVLLMFRLYSNPLYDTVCLIRSHHTINSIRMICVVYLGLVA